MIPESFIQELLHRVDVVEVVERHVKLKRTGANYSACCPFHSEKTPSFTVSPTKQFYHCFGCGAHGTAIGFLMEHSGLGFVEAVRDLAQTVGMQVPEAQGEAVAGRARGAEDLRAVLLTAARYYRSRLKSAPHAIAYLKQRGLSGEIARKFGIGYAPDTWQALSAAFPDYAAKSLVAAGLVKQGEEGKRYDLFRDRIMFPIVDIRGNVIGFGGRVMGAKAGPKYLNSPETALFEKGRELYGLYQARRAIRESGRVIVVEGYMDVVALAQHGVEYAVATLGTATSSAHVQKLLRQADEIVFCFDGDDAGRRAAWRALENSLSQLQDGKRLAFLFLPQGEDPDSYVRQHGKPAFEKRLAAALPLSRYLLEELRRQADTATAEGRAALVHAAKPLLKQMAPTAFRAQLVKEIAEAARVSTTEVEALCGITPAAAAKTPARPSSPGRPLPPGVAQRLLRVLVCQPRLAATLTAAQRELLAADVALLSVAALVDNAVARGISSAPAVFEAMKDTPFVADYEAAAAAALRDGLDDDTAAALLEGELRSLELQQVQAEYERLASGSLDPEARARFTQVSRRLAELKGVATVGVESRR